MKTLQESILGKNYSNSLDDVKVDYSLLKQFHNVDAFWNHIIRQVVNTYNTVLAARYSDEIKTRIQEMRKSIEAMGGDPDSIIYSNAETDAVGSIFMITFPRNSNYTIQRCFEDLQRASEMMKSSLEIEKYMEDLMGASKWKNYKCVVTDSSHVGQKGGFIVEVKKDPQLEELVANGPTETPSFMVSGEHASKVSMIIFRYK